MTRRRAVVAMSGGVDSSVAAALLVDEGYDVTGVMLKLWKGEAVNNDSGCCNLGAAEDARRVADVLGIPFYVFNFAERFEDSVIRDFQESYASGSTPNPCVRCNQWIKFDALLERAKALGADVLATGHYARTALDGDVWRLYRGTDAAKDQSYVLWMLGQSQLRHCRFPVGEMEKSETRAMAERFGLRTAQKPDSQEICFVRGGDTSAYIDEKVGAATEPGPLVHVDGTVLGRHRGVGHYTVGQRKGLGVSLGVPMFVTGIDAASNVIVVGERSSLGIASLITRDSSFVSESPADGTLIQVQHRAHGEAVPALLKRSSGDGCLVVFEEPAEAVAPGQSAAFYRGDELIGGGIIETTTPAGLVSEALVEERAGIPVAAGERG